MPGNNEGIQKFSLDTMQRRDGTMGSFAKIDIGEPDNPSRPTMTHIRMRPDQISPRHSHEGWACSIVLEGSCTYDGDLYKVGDLLLAEGGKPYGPLLPGEDGVTILEVFEANNRFAPQWEDPNDPHAVALRASFGDNPPWGG